jgi:hypothetical protein
LDSTEAASVELPEVRVEGMCRRIAMRQSHWNVLQSQISRTIFHRLHAAFKRFCDGCDNLPEQIFRRVESDRHGRLEEFVSGGVRVIGRRGTEDRFQTFFATEIQILAEPPLVNNVAAPRQATLPFENRKEKGTGR